MQAADLTAERTGIACAILSLGYLTVVIETQDKPPRRVTLPRGQVEINADCTAVTMPEWLAIERGLIA